MPAEPHIVFVNAARLEVPPGATALDAVRAWNPAVADEVAGGARRVADARGLPIGADSPCYGGAIFRVIGPARPGVPDEPAAE